MSQEEVAEKLGVSRQTISKWELNETLPDIRQSKRLSGLYHLTLDELIDFDIDVKEIQDAIDRTSEAVSEKVDWTKAWSKKYPILATYQGQVQTEMYAKELKRLLDDRELTTRLKSQASCLFVECPSVSRSYFGSTGVILSCSDSPCPTVFLIFCLCVFLQIHFVPFVFDIDSCVHVPVQL